jgi:rod shape-determining protein MreC
MTGKQFLAGLIILTLLVLMTLSSNSREWARVGIRKNLAPIQNLLAGGDGIIGASSVIFRPRAILEKNRLLEEQVGNLRLELTQVDILKSENERLRNALGMVSRTSHRLVLCQVTTRGDISGWWQTLSIDRGAAHGIRSGMPVLTPEGVVGRTQHVTAYNSEVLLLTDPTFKISCRTSRSGLLGIVQGQGTGINGDETLGGDFALNPCRFDLATRSTPILEGESILTSGLGGIFPPDLTIGYLTQPALDDSKLFQTACVIPAVALDRLDRVFVMLDAGDNSIAKTDEEHP